MKEKEFIGYAKLLIYGQNKRAGIGSEYALYEVFKDHEDKCIFVKIAEDQSIEPTLQKLPNYDDDATKILWNRINEQKGKAQTHARHFPDLPSKTSRKTTSSFGRTYASRPTIEDDSAYIRPMRERKPTKQMTEAEVRRLIDEAFKEEF